MNVGFFLIEPAGVGGLRRAVMVASAFGDIQVADALLLVSPFIIDRVERLSVSTSGLELQLSREISGLGAPKTAGSLSVATLLSSPSPMPSSMKSFATRSTAMRKFTCRICWLSELRQFLVGKN